MAINQDFDWFEVGERVRERRLTRALSQQSVAEAAGLTQNAVFRIEAGETNQQVSTLKSVAAALGCTVRELVCGTSGNEPRLTGRFERVCRVVESGDDVAIRVMDSGIENAEALLERSGGRRGLQPLRMKGEGRQSEIDKLFWKQPLVRRRSEADDYPPVEAVQKAVEPFRESNRTHETKNKNRRP